MDSTSQTAEQATASKVAPTATVKLLESRYWHVRFSANKVFACPNFVAIPGKLTALNAWASSIDRRIQTISRRIPVRRKVKR